jgi:hypothetical protein
LVFCPFNKSRNTGKEWDNCRRGSDAPFGGANVKSRQGVLQFEIMQSQRFPDCLFETLSAGLANTTVRIFTHGHLNDPNPESGL